MYECICYKCKNHFMSENKRAVWCGCQPEEKDISKKIIRLVKKYRDKVQNNKRKYEKTDEFNFFGGYNAGYAEGKLAAYEDIADELEIDVDRASDEDRARALRQLTRHT